MQRAAELLSEITNLASFAVTPTKNEDKVRFVNLLPVDDHTVVLMIVAESGKVSNTTLKLRVPYTAEMLNILAKNITYNYKGRTISDVLTDDISHDFNSDLAAMNMLAGSIMPNFMRTLSEMLNVHLYLDGLSNIFDIPEYNDLDKARMFLKMMKQKDRFTEVLDNRADGVIITIGEENTDEETAEAWLSPYQTWGRYI